MQKDKDRHRNKVLPLDVYRGKADDGKNTPENSVHQLLQHMRRMRETVPVNYQLQEELRQKLINQKEDSGRVDFSNRHSTQNIVKKVPKKIWMASALLLIIFLAFLCWFSSRPGVLQPLGSPREVVKFWNSDPNISFTVSPTTGDVLLSRYGQLLLVRENESSYRVLDLPSKWLYHYPVFSPDGRMVAFVRQDKDKNDGQQIVVVPAEWLTAPGESLSFKIEPVVINNHNREITSLSWSPDSSKLAYSTFDHFGMEKVWVVEKEKNLDPQMVAEGTNPTWSPDGSRIIVQRSEFLYLVNLERGKEIKLGQGEQPFWCSSGYVAFVSTRQHEKVLTFMQDGSPQFTVQRRVGEIRSVYAGENGDLLWNGKENIWLPSSTMLASPGGRSTYKEMDWLRRLEIEGVREPRILILDEVDRCQNPVLLEDENTLYYIHQDDIYASLMQVSIKEQLFDKGEK